MAIFPLEFVLLLFFQLIFSNFFFKLFSNNVFFYFICVPFSCVYVFFSLLNDSLSPMMMSYFRKEEKKVMILCPANWAKPHPTLSYSASAAQFISSVCLSVCGRVGVCVCVWHSFFHRWIGWWKIRAWSATIAGTL